MWHRKYFLPAHNVNPVQDYYICKPDTGLSITGVNFFQDESLQSRFSVPARKTSLIISSNFNKIFSISSGPGRRNAISQPAASPARKWKFLQKLSPAFFHMLIGSAILIIYFVRDLFRATITVYKFKLGIEQHPVNKCFRVRIIKGH